MIYVRTPKGISGTPLVLFCDDCDTETTQWMQADEDEPSAADIASMAEEHLDEHGQCPGDGA